MGTTDKEAIEQQRMRRKRINRIKNTIILTIACWMIFSLLAILVLSVQVVRLNTKVKHLEKKLSKTTVVMQQDIQGSDTEIQVSETVNESSEEGEPNGSETETVGNDTVVTGIDTDDNWAQEGDLHYVYLTFDSELGSNTITLLDKLAECNVKATFFISASDVEEAPEICQRIVAEGHTIGMHSYSNQYSTIYASAEAFAADFTKISDYVYDLTGIRSQFYRFPGGSGNEISNVDMTEFVKILNQNSIIYFDWNVSAGDAATDYEVQDVVSNVVTGVAKYKTSVVLLHDAPEKAATIDALDELVQELNQMGAVVLPIDVSTTPIQYIKADSVE